MIDTLDGLHSIIKNAGNIHANTYPYPYYNFYTSFIDVITLINNYDFEYYCSKCSDKRLGRVKVLKSCCVYMDFNGNLIWNSLPLLIGITCNQCYNEALLLIYAIKNDIQLVVIYNTYDNCTTPNTPEEVKYYIDQAFRAKAVGLFTASVAMYRSAIEWILYEQGYQKGMLGQKISDLKADIDNGTAKKCAMSIDTELLEALKDIGNGAVHTNNGDITKQQKIDEKLLKCINNVVYMLLNKIYEQHIEDDKNLKLLKPVQQEFKK